jgi:hypothetical protein
MNKKLLVVLVIVAAILVTGAWVVAAKRSPTGTEALKQAPEDLKGVERPAKTSSLPKLSHQQSVTPMPEAPAIEKKAVLNEANGRPQKALPSHTLLSGTPVRLGAPSGKDLCDLAGTAAYFITGYIWGLEWYANYQDPVEHACTDVWPFKVSEIDFQMNFPATWVAMDVSLQGFILADLGTPSCPEPGYYLDDVICSTSVYTYNIPAGGGYFVLPLPMTDSCCLNHPYFAAVHIITDLYGLGVDAVAEGTPATCRSYNDYGAGWGALNGWPGPIMLYSQGYTHPQNTCPVPPADTCYVTSIVPATQTVLAGALATYTVNVAFGGTVTSCNLTVTPDPACPSCVTTVTPNPVPSSSPSSQLTIQTSLATTAGTYTFSVNGAKVSATLIVVAPNDTCEIARYIAAPGYYYGGWAAGDQNAVLLNPASCISCGGDVYPFHIMKVKSRWVNSSGTATSANVIFHIFEADTPYCNGPGAEICQFPATITAWSPNYVTVPVPEIVCVDQPFWLAAEYVSVTPPGVLPSLRFSNQTYADTCTQFIYFASDAAWYEWADVWTPPPPGYYYLSAIGQCEGDACPIECNMAQDNGVAAGYASWIWEGFQVAKYYDPEDYCEPPVYPYLISDVEFPLYKWGAAAPQANVQIAIYLNCQDSCNGPGTQIYLSDVYNITSFYPNWTHIELPEPVCVYEPFFVAIRWAAGPTPMPSLLMDNNLGMPGDSCHQWFFDPDVPEWVEHHNWWGSPEAVGITMLRVSGATNHFECVQEPCDEDNNILADYGTPTWIWALPSTSGRNYPNERFNLPADFGGRLDSVGFYFYGMTGDPNPTIYIWTTDGAGHPWDNNPPYQALAEFPILTAQINPDGMTWISTWQRGLKFDPEDEFFAGYSFVFDAGDALKLLSDDYNDPLNTSTRAGFYWPASTPYGPAWLNVFERYAMYMSFIVEAAICPEAPPNPTFTLNVTPSTGYATPGDPPVHYTADVEPILNYSLLVTLDLASVTPPPVTGTITATFTPNGQAPPLVSDVAVTADASVPYGNYVLTIRATGSDLQVRTKDVNLIVQPPYDERLVQFNHGKQRASNFGAVGNDKETDNFLWYDRTSQLFDGSFIIATTDSGHMALDVFNCVHWGWTPTQHINCYFDPVYNANICYGNFFTTEEVISCEYDSVFIVGIMDECVDFSIKIKVYYNPTTTPIVGMYPAIYEDWDVGRTSAATANNTVEMDPTHNLMWQYQTTQPDTVFGIMKAPFDDLPMHSMVAVSNPRYVYPNAGFCAGWGLDSLYYLISTPGYYNTATSDTDMSLLMSAPPIDLPPGGKHIEVWIDFGFAGTFSDAVVRRMWYHRVLRYAGFYRGDVNASDSLEVPALDATDLVYLINYLFRNGPAPKPYKDQGDVNADRRVDVRDIVYLINSVFISGPAPRDYVRFIPQMWDRPSLFWNTNWH